MHNIFVKLLTDIRDVFNLLFDIGYLIVQDLFLYFYFYITVAII